MNCIEDYDHIAPFMAAKFFVSTHPIKTYGSITNMGKSLLALPLGRCSRHVQATVARMVFEEWRRDFARGEIMDPDACRDHFLGESPTGQMKCLYVVVGRPADLRRGVRPRACIIGTVAITSKDFNLHISNLQVAPEYRRQGIGRRILAFAEDRCRATGISTTNLWGSEDLVEFYAREGWLPQDRVEMEPDMFVQTMVKLL